MAQTQADRWKQMRAKYRKQCQKILELSENIRYVGVINEYGRTMAGLIKPELRPLLNSKNAKKEFFMISTLITLRDYSTKVMGKLDYILIQHYKISIIVLHKDTFTYYISINKKEKNPELLVPEIEKMI